MSSQVNTIMSRLLHALTVSALFATTAFAANQTCKITPLDSTWPDVDEWSALNGTINGTLLKTSPVASSCYSGNPFNSPDSCEAVEGNWTLLTFHASLPESIDYPLFANNSCLPPGSTGYTADKGCAVGAYPQYVVNATTEEQVAASMAWASARDIRIVVKGTGHDMNGRSSGAYSMSVWTHNFKKLEFDSEWALPGGNGTTDVVIAGSGNNWGLVYTAADKNGKSVVGGGSSSVGLGGFIQGGGHGPLSSTYGLAADQILQATIVTTEGQILVANAQNNTDLLWAIRGGGGGQYGVVTEYVLQTHPAPSSVVLGSLSLSINGTDNSSITAVWNAYATLVMSLPDLMDAGLAGAGFSTTEAGIVGLEHSQSFYGYNISSSNMTAMVEPVLAKMRAQGNNTTLSVTWGEPVTYPNFTSFFLAQNPTSEGAGSSSVMSSRLLGRAQLTNNVTQEEVVSNLQKAFMTQEPNGGSYIVIGMQGGPGPAKVAENMRGALNPVWRTSYLHTVAFGASVNTTADPETTLTAAADWLDENLEAFWREWAPDTGSYMNEGNPYNTEFKHDFYGTSYDRLLEIKKKYDPTESLYVLTGVGSDGWDYNLNSGKLCRTT